MKRRSKSRYESGQSDALLGYTRTNHAGATITFAPRGLLIGRCMKERVRSITVLRDRNDANNTSQ